jgi:hypothetical protein
MYATAESKEFLLRQCTQKLAASKSQVRVSLSEDYGRNVQNCKIESSECMVGPGIIIESVAVTEMDGLSSESRVFEDTLANSGLSDIEGAGEIETELVALLVDVSVLNGGRLPHSKYRVWLERRNNLDRVSRRCAAEWYAVCL